MRNQKIKIYDYTAVFEEAEEGGYVVYVPVLPGCVTQGDTFEEAQKMAKDAIEGYLLALKDLHEEIPKESENVIITRIPARMAI
ncbi:MAG: hypothetical protein A3I88_03350 [Candidatus Portnoybacteria bacterium RIFCSPLOWO2_12_FULL_39_9]|uniref:HicB-like antitoxin of toxin-antitoxin system domain-containing protein n=1 Tax=Candidatus Portnoybacteria bacterium RIFCSPHIGHO2_12_FULL_38_9 TaxID=1801997 RepID=A0A1G2FHM9_9BACT|nr:MAG: hypothetical protein A3H00_02800 [Candidatus Portnoybacteria bacterium RBG_13_40_8]OGZ36133.1 MAG: hypothetical protein A2646_02435 [Candidatus Portnoybacteria bacterium RIFCSPHIGHO2_02_FULL_39_12]OGZ37292.1 MAG: hypothetical protein A3J64_01525 [Candidatus Portnoybacteria bacterium RIFCSPHIGHO2_12_FULL_38_9]OGZ40643.1 MAG: hypothetical protein A3I88_03350 [Candidatus Portnoybacteria bacterium RIFCSPLOWO2_12_FULL_39_9]